MLLVMWVSSRLIMCPYSYTLKKAMAEFPEIDLVGHEKENYSRGVRDEYTGRVQRSYDWE